MKKSVLTSISALLFLTPLAYGGVVMEMTSKDAAGNEKDRSTIYSQSAMIRIDDVGDKKDAASMIFLGDKFLYVDHKDRSYIVMDEAMLEEVSAKVSDAMKQMEQQLANLPPEQRAMVEQMMKGQMQGMMDNKDAAPAAHKVTAMGNSKWQSYDCRRYAVFEGKEKTQEVCAADLDEIDGADEVMAAFRRMAAYMTKMTESMPMGAGDHVNPVELMDQIDGFPVHTIDYRNGQVVTEMSLDSVVEKDLDSDLFGAPEGYRRQDPFGAR